MGTNLSLVKKDLMLILNLLKYLISEEIYLQKMSFRTVTFHRQTFLHYFQLIRNHHKV
jgi:hypothetical protein